MGFGLEVGYAKVASQVVYIRAWLRLAPLADLRADQVTVTVEPPLTRAYQGRQGPIRGCWRDAAKVNKPPCSCQPPSSLSSPTSAAPKPHNSKEPSELQNLGNFTKHS